MRIQGQENRKRLMMLIIMMMVVVIVEMAMRACSKDSWLQA